MLSHSSIDRTGAINGEELRRAIAQQDLVLLFQPKFSCQDPVCVGAEALVRWMHPTHGLIAPDAFIALAEQTGQIHDLGQWVLRAACRQLRVWRDAGAADWTMAINVSPQQLQRPGFYAAVCGALGDNRIPADRLVLEVTESALMHDPDACLKQLYNLFGLGVQVSLDDFGTGFSSLARLKQMPVHEVKIAREFIEELDRSEVDRSIVAAIIGMARSLELRVVAEGVEREGQAWQLQRLGCDQTQGYLHSPPIRAELFMHRFGPAVPVPAARMQAGTLAHV
ncbi:EAL domain-containing protein [Bacillus subtilis subsp. subtilis]|nr:EAL domain-containing protein [Bacillus subtilis subsp. subtilis]